MENEFQESKCKNCKTTLLESKNETRTPCPVCGEISREFYRNIEDNIVIQDQLNIKGRHSASKKSFFEERIGADFYIKEIEWHHVVRVIDRDNDKYIETITNPKTGAVIKNTEEPLSEHKGHGSAKRR